MSRPRLTVLAGPTAVGKGTVAAWIREHHPEVWLSVSATTRAFLRRPFRAVRAALPPGAALRPAEASGEGSAGFVSCASVSFRSGPALVEGPAPAAASLR